MTDPASFQTDPAWAAKITAEEEADVRAWVNGKMADEYPHHAPILARMLARPVMPEKPTSAMLTLMCEAWDRPRNSTDMGAVYRALYAHVTKKKMKPVFHLAGSGNQKIGGDLPLVWALTADFNDLNQMITALCNDGFQVVTVRREMVPE